MAFVHLRVYVVCGEYLVADKLKLNMKAVLLHKELSKLHSIGEQNRIVVVICVV